MNALERIAEEHLPENIGLEWSGLSYQEKNESGNTAFVLALALLFVFLFLAALYESWTVPVAVILSLPVAGLGAYLGIWICGLENNIYFQIGLVMLVGLVAKNAILIVEFAKAAREDENKSVYEAAMEAADIRFRAVMMTGIAFILGMVPLVLAVGSGAESRKALGTAVFGGMVIAVTVGAIMVPAFYAHIQKQRERAKKDSDIRKQRHIKEIRENE